MERYWAIEVNLIGERECGREIRKSDREEAHTIHDMVCCDRNLGASYQQSELLFKLGI